MNESVFAKYVLTDEKLKNLMSKCDFKKFISLKQSMGTMDFALASKIAEAMKKWALSLGATHYTHWFFPLTSKSAEKQVSFLDIDSKGTTLEKFDGNCLIKGETDASSFPSGNERMTFEARGYTVWDYSSPVFIKSDLVGNKVMYIPTAFCSYNGASLDEKTPLLRATDILNINLVKFLHIMGLNNVKKVFCNLGCEQEYFLIERDKFNQRKDLVLTGRTLLSAPALKSQKMHHHYFCNINPKISAFMHELDGELWELGILAKTQHNEVAPHQFEIVPLYSNSNISTDQNILMMEVMEKVAEKHGLKVLFHEKPFQNINGSGKHNNWSISTDTGINLLDKTQVPLDVFMIVFTAVLAAVANHYDLIRLSSATLSNDLRLGGDEAPPSIFSVYIGQNMVNLIAEFLSNCSVKPSPQKILDTKTSSTVKIFKDDCDRNRTSPFAFTGNKFEFRMVGSSQNIAICNSILSMIVAAEFEKINKVLSSSSNIQKDIKEIVNKNFRESAKIIFNGNSYDDDWASEARARGLVFYQDSITCYKRLLDDGNIDLFEKLGVMSKTEVLVHYDTLLDNYIDCALLEARTLLNLIASQAVPSLRNFEMHLLNLAENQAKFKIKNNSAIHQAREIEATLSALRQNINNLTSKINTRFADKLKMAEFVRDEVLPLTNQIRKLYDSMEEKLPVQFKPFPNYDDLLFS